MPGKVPSSSTGGAIDLSGQMSVSVLDALPDPFQLDDVRRWIDDMLGAIKALPTGSETPFYAVDLPVPSATHPLGAHGDERWRRGLLAILVADWASYSETAQRLDFDRLALVASRFARGFRIWFGTNHGQCPLPVGYTGWYPIARTVYDQFVAGDSRVIERLVVPARVLEANPYVYLFNFSVVEALRRPPFSGSLLRSYWQDIDALAPRGLAAVTVSEDGDRVVRRAGMRAVRELSSDSAVSRLCIR